jgi:uncharacterized RDD family membrane protein YckC
VGARKAASTQLSRGEATSNRSASGAETCRALHRLERAESPANNCHPLRWTSSSGQEPPMSQVAEMGAKPMIMDPYEIGWYIESADEEIYGPVSRKALRRFLEDKTISPNTLVRHCTQPEAKPAADQPVIMENVNLDASRPAVGDRLADAWPKKSRDRQALAEDTLACIRHKGPAVLVCVRCHAPYCSKCRAKPLRKQFFFCRRCQVGVWNRRFGAFVLDLIVMYVVLFAATFLMMALGASQTMQSIVINVVAFGAAAFLFVRDAVFDGAGIGKRIVGLRVVQAKDGKTPLTIGQGIVRWLSQYVPIFNLVDAQAAFADPLMRRYGDRWAGTRVIDTEAKLENDRHKVALRLVKKNGVQPLRKLGITMEELAQIA